MRIWILTALAGLFALAAAAMPGAQTGASEPRVALVIGNSTYDTPGWTLENPARDARLMKAALEGLGFEVDIVLNADEDEMEEAFASFGARLKEAGPDATGFFFYAGHGVQSEGLNYLIPTDLVAYNEADVWANAPRLELLFRYLDNAGNAANFIILDACRNNPLPSAVRNTGGGLAATGRVRGTLIAYSTAPGAVAEDGTVGNSEFTLALSELIATPGIAAETLFRRVATRVEQRTNYRQQPWIESGLRGNADFCFAGCDSNEAARSEAAALTASLSSNSVGVLESFLAAFPDSGSRSLVEARIDQLQSPEKTGLSASGTRDTAEPEVTSLYDIVGKGAPEEGPAGTDGKRRVTEGQMKEALGVSTLISDLVTPWRKDVMQTAGRAAFMARTVEGAPEYELLDDGLFVFFAQDSATLDAAARSNLKAFATYVARPHVEGERPGYLRVVSGCMAGESMTGACRQRSAVVENQLVEMGVPRAAFEAQMNYGKHRQLEDPGFGIDEDALNRYAMVQLLR
ncbi:caspase family protein [Henriciella sp.]|uniref:caspase family protein n=1 Tax=Henriciella sp. TaxID=1968823 RepID=UPI00260FDA72|nr:caspase family protein [Henriciella sp.]